MKFSDIMSESSRNESRGDPVPFIHVKIEKESSPPEGNGKQNDDVPYIHIKGEPRTTSLKMKTRRPSDRVEISIKHNASVHPYSSPHTIRLGRSPNNTWLGNSHSPRGLPYLTMYHSSSMSLAPTRTTYHGHKSSPGPLAPSSSSLSLSVASTMATYGSPFTPLSPASPLSFSKMSTYGPISSPLRPSSSSSSSSALSLADKMTKLHGPISTRITPPSSSSSAALSMDPKMTTYHGHISPQITPLSATSALSLDTKMATFDGPYTTLHAPTPSLSSSAFTRIKTAFNRPVSSTITPSSLYFSTPNIHITRQPHRQEKVLKSSYPPVHCETTATERHETIVTENGCSPQEKELKISEVYNVLYPNPGTEIYSQEHSLSTETKEEVKRTASDSGEIATENDQKDEKMILRPIRNQQEKTLESRSSSNGHDITAKDKQMVKFEPQGDDVSEEDEKEEEEEYVEEDDDSEDEEEQMDGNEEEQMDGNEEEEINGNEDGTQSDVSDSESDLSNTYDVDAMRNLYKKDTDIGRKHASKRQVKPEVTVNNDIEFNDDNGMQSSSKTTEDQEKRDCNICGTSFQSNHQLRQHYTLHYPQQKLFNCSSCDKSFSSKENLRRHMKIHKLLECTICGVVLKSRRSLRRHQYMHLSGVPEKSRNQSRTCTVCHIQFLTRKAFRKHVELYPDHYPYQCGICCKMFITKPGIRKHMFIHTNPDYARCTVCEKVFPDKASCEQHTIETHQNERPHQCEICHRPFKRLAHKLTHMKNIHYQKPSFHCPECQAVFRYHKSFKNHLKTHNGVDSKPPMTEKKCPFCPKVYKNEKCMQTHMENYHAEELNSEYLQNEDNLAMGQMVA